MKDDTRTNLDLHDIQGNIVKGYGRYGFPFARYVFFHIYEMTASRKFILDLLPLITTGEPWQPPGDVKSKAAPMPLVTTNAAFTFEGLKQTGLSEASLQSFPYEFTMGMKARREILGDDGVSGPDHWDPIWKSEMYSQSVHMMVTINGKMAEAVEERYQDILQRATACGQGIQLMRGHRSAAGDSEPYQDGSAVFIDGKPSAKEHFGYTDGIGDPYFKGSGSSPSYMIGNGKVTREDPATKQGWEPLETGEFLLGHRDEADEYPEGPNPRLLSHNGTYMVYRKLHENVGSFNRYLDGEGAKFPDGKEALAAKFCGRWRNGAPITTYPTEEKANAFIEELTQSQDEYFALLKKVDNGETVATQTIAQARKRYHDLKIKRSAFNFNDDIEGSRCPQGAHIRRANPRGSLEAGKTGAFETPGALVNRRRIARRGLPYGTVTDPTSDDGDHGVIIMILCADINRQFEFVQQQWMNYGNDFRLANEKDPLIGNHGPDDGTMVMPGNKTKKPYFCSGIARFVETRGGDYFFIPSMTALRMIGEGIVDPT